MGAAWREPSLAEEDRDAIWPRARSLAVSSQAMAADVEMEQVEERPERECSASGERPSGPAKSPQQDASTLRDSYRDVGAWPSDNQLPIVYHRAYNISFLWMEKLHTMDSWKFAKVLSRLQAEGLIEPAGAIAPLEASDAVLSDVHPQAYLTELRTSKMAVMRVTELQPLLLLPNALIQWKFVGPLRFHTAGTILAAGIAVERGWAINLGGGLHHASRSNGMGWCAYDDVYLAVRRVRSASHGRVTKVMVIDLDVHQGNGFATDKLEFQDDDLFVVDVYNNMIFPKDEPAKKGIDVAKELTCGTDSATYVQTVKEALSEAGQKFAPDLILYLAGTDVLEDDPMGRFKVTAADVIKRDEMVFSFALGRQTPICMMLSGGYGPSSADVSSSSIINLTKTFNLRAPSASAP